jgi:hypothetical protein
MTQLDRYRLGEGCAIRTDCDYPLAWVERQCVGRNCPSAAATTAARVLDARAMTMGGAG